MTQENTRKYAGADWIRSATDCHPVSDFGALVADILGAAFRGLYHLDNRALLRTDWSSTRCVVFLLRFRQDLATWDFEELTSLVVLCHDACVRLSIEARSRGYLRLTFCARSGREGDIALRHPTLEDAARRVRELLGDFRPDEERA